MVCGLWFVVDTAFYVPEKLAELNDVHRITRVPAQINEALGLLKTSTNELIWQVFNENYRVATQSVTIHGIQQRWLLIEYKHPQKRELETFQRRLNKKSEELCKTRFA